MFNQNARLLVRIGEPRSQHSKGQLQQLIPCVFVIPDIRAGEMLSLRVDQDLKDLQEQMTNPHVQGRLPVEDEDNPPAFQVLIWPASDNEAEQDEHYKKDPLKLEDVTLGRFTAYPMSDYEGSTGVTIQLTAPYRSESLAGKVDKLAGSPVRMQISELQTKLDV